VPRLKILKKRPPQPAATRGTAYRPAASLPSRDVAAENSCFKRVFGVGTRAPKLTFVSRLQLSRSEDMQVESGVWSCIPLSNLMQLRAATTAELAHRTRIGYQDFPKQQPERGRL
jgi:hypothetical protein